MKKTIGILGGMGPDATGDLYLKIIRYFQNTCNAQYDGDYPNIIINSIPIPDVVQALENEKKTIQSLIRGSLVLEKAGCSFIAIACNTVQYMIPFIQNEIKIPILSIAKTVSLYLSTVRIKRVGIMSTALTIKKNDYKNALTQNNIALVVPTEQEQKTITNIIVDKLSNRINQNNIVSAIKVITHLKEKGAEAILLACTELPLIFTKHVFSIPLIDCTQIYAQRIAQFSNKTEPIINLV